MISYEVIASNQGDYSKNASNWITLINGYTRSKADFKFLAKNLASRGFCVLIFDNRGSGDSKTRGSFTLKDMAQDVIELWKHEKIYSSGLLGISMGGFIAQEILEISDVVSQLVLVSSAARCSAVRRNINWGTSLEEVLANLEPYFSRDYWISNPKIPRGMAKQILEKSGTDAFREQMKSQTEAMAGFDISMIKSQKTVPVLIVHGLEDHIIRYEETKALMERFDNVRLELVPKVGHLMLAESPRALFELVAEFLKG